MKSEKVSFPGAFGNRIAARLDRPEQASFPCAIFAHCFSCSKDMKSVNWISRMLAERGLGVLRFDFTGLGESEGEFAETNFSSNLADLLSAAEFLRSHYRGPEILIGHSLGGVAVLAAASQVAEVRMVATIAAPSTTRQLHHTLLSHNPQLRTEDKAEMVMGKYRVPITRQLLDDLLEHKVSDAIANLNRPLLVFHAPDDPSVDIAHAEQIFHLARQPKSFIALDGADHLLLRSPEDARYVADVLLAWARRYLALEVFGD